MPGSSVAEHLAGPLSHGGELMASPAAVDSPTAPSPHVMPVCDTSVTRCRVCRASAGDVGLSIGRHTDAR